MIANLEPLWAQPDPLMTELTLPRVGAARGARQYQIASLQQTSDSLNGLVRELRASPQGALGKAPDKELKVKP